MTQGALSRGQRLGNYEVEHWLGGGGMGAVYAVRHIQTGAPFALKVLHASLSRDADLRRRFFREARAASRLDHPNAVRVVDVSGDNAVPYFVMERLYGEDLRSLLDREGALSARRACALLVPVAQATAHAHTRGVIHRDLKPENVFLAHEADGRLVPKVLDFGVSKLLDEVSVTCDSALLGTPSYMAPEQLEGAAKASRASDQYALGVILYEVLVGEAPFADRSVYALLTAIAAGEFVRPGARVPELDPRLESVVLRAMAKDPSARYASVAELVFELSMASGLARVSFARSPSRLDRERAPTLLGTTASRYPAAAREQVAL